MKSCEITKVPLYKKFDQNAMVPLEKLIQNIKGIENSCISLTYKISSGNIVKLS